MITVEFTYNEKINDLQAKGNPKDVVFIIHQILRIVGEISINKINKKRGSDYGK
jgi:hypothetical protein